MSLNEFTIIDTYFKKHFHRDDVALGSGDDCAVLSLPSDKQLIATTDTLNENIHFFPDTAPEDIGYKAIAVSLSDIAAMGGEPRWALVSLTLPVIDESWLAAFSKGIFACLDQFGVQLVGGNLSRGPLCVTSQLLGSVDQNKYLTRSGALPNDLIYVTGTLGDSGLALALLQNKINVSKLSVDEQKLINRLWHPKPRIHEGKLLVNLANAAIDISDGLIDDLQHILAQSKVGATFYLESLPMSTTLQKLPIQQANLMALSSGDDYELCFTISSENLPMLMKKWRDIDCALTCIGKIEGQPGLRIIQPDGKQFIDAGISGFKHW